MTEAFATCFGLFYIKSPLQTKKIMFCNPWPQRFSVIQEFFTTGVRSCYDEGKRVAETLMFDYHRQHGLGNVMLCFLHQTSKLLIDRGYSQFIFLSFF